MNDEPKFVSECCCCDYTVKENYVNANEIVGTYRVCNKCNKVCDGIELEQVEALTEKARIEKVIRHNRPGIAAHQLWGEFRKQLEKAREELEITKDSRDQGLEQLSILGSRYAQLEKQLEQAQRERDGWWKEVERHQKIEVEQNEQLTRAREDLAACEKERDGLKDKLDEIKSRNLNNALKGICEECGHKKTEDGCAYCIKESLNVTLKCQCGKTGLVLEMLEHECDATAKLKGESK